MILRLLRVRLLPGAEAELVSRLREQAVPQIAATDELVGVALANCPEPGLHASLLSLPTDRPDARPFEQILAEAFPALPVAR